MRLVYQLIAQYLRSRLAVRVLSARLLIAIRFGLVIPQIAFAPMTPHIGNDLTIVIVAIGSCPLIVTG